MPNDPPVRLLPWDSEFFGQRIARLESTRLDHRSADLVDRWCRREGIDCLYFLADPSDPLTPHCAAERGFRLVDIRVTLDRPGDRPAPPPPHGGLFTVRKALQEDIPALRAIALSNHRESRFYYDGGFGRDRCDELYATWIEKSCRGWAEVVLVATAGPDPAGYISCHLNDGCGQIGLLGVSALHRGGGAGALMIGAAIGWFASKSVPRIEVVTQGRNVSAQRLYQKAGFRTSEIGLWFHRRYGRGDHGG